MNYKKKKKNSVKLKKKTESDQLFGFLLLSAGIKNLENPESGKDFNNVTDSKRIKIYKTRTSHRF